MKILLATSNPHKLDEIRAVLGSAGYDLLSLIEAEVDVHEPVEDGETFEANAVLKAAYYAGAGKMLCLADDSGLVVDALDGDPGVRSARFAAVEGPRDVVDPANNALLMERLGDTPDERRTARFVCTMALCAPDRAAPVALVRGTVEGRIITREHGPRGESGFGYDPLFLLPDRGVTVAQLSPEEKNAISHRGNAARLMLNKLRQRPTE